MPEVSGFSGVDLTSIDSLSGLSLSNIASISGLDTPENSIVTTGLYHHWDASDTSSYSGTGYTWTDLEANNNLSLYGGVDTSFVSTSPEHFDFDGVNDYAGTSTWSQPSSSNFSIETWVRFDGQGTYNQMVCTSQADRVFTFILFNNRTNAPAGTPRGMVFAVWDGNGSSSNTLLGVVYAPTALSTNTWYHVVAIRNGAKIYIYINGTEDANASISSSTALNTSSVFEIGRRSITSAPDYLNGDIGELRFYEKALTSTEVSSNWGATKSKYGL